MSSRAQRLPAGAEVQSFDWHGTWIVSDAPAASLLDDLSAPSSSVLPSAIVDAAEIERDAFTRGYAQGERAAAEAHASRNALALQRLATAVDELNALRADVLRQTERQIVQLSLAIARRIVNREITLDRELVATMARVALDRLGRPANARIHLHPDDCASLGGHPITDGDGSTQIVADPSIKRGGCVVHSDFGRVDLNVDAQIAEVETALLGSPTAADAPAPETAFAA